VRIRLGPAVGLACAGLAIVAVNALARAADRAPDFSRRIRAGLP